MPAMTKKSLERASDRCVVYLVFNGRFEGDIHSQSRAMFPVL